MPEIKVTLTNPTPISQNRDNDSGQLKITISNVGEAIYGGNLEEMSADEKQAFRDFLWCIQPDEAVDAALEIIDGAPQYDGYDASDFDRDSAEVNYAF